MTRLFGQYHHRRMPTRRPEKVRHWESRRHLLQTPTLAGKQYREKVRVLVPLPAARRMLRERHPWQQSGGSTECRSGDHRDFSQKVNQCKMKTSAEDAAIVATKEQGWRRKIRQNLGQPRQQD